MVLICSDVGHLFHVLIDRLYIFFEEMSIHIICSFLKLGCPFIT